MFDRMWREIRLLSESKPVVASMSDVAASGGYYMAMAAGTIVAENLTLTGSIGVVTGKFFAQVCIAMKVKDNSPAGQMSKIKLQNFGYFNHAIHLRVHFSFRHSHRSMDTT